MLRRISRDDFLGLVAIGATQRRVLCGVTWKSLRLAFVGMGVGTVSIGAARLIASLLFGTAPTDPFTFAGMLVLLGAVALLAGFLPAHRAARIDPMLALRTN